jgi:hypothetical protein
VLELPELTARSQCAQSMPLEAGSGRCGHQGKKGHLAALQPWLALAGGLGSPAWPRARARGPSSVSAPQVY